MNSNSTGRAIASSKRSKGISKSHRAGVIFPVARLHRFLKRSTPKTRVSVSAAVYTAAVIEYLAAEVLELSGNAARDNNRTRITPRHIFLAVSIDEELKKLLKQVTISQGGNLPFIHPALVKNKTTPKITKSKIVESSTLVDSNHVVATETVIPEAETKGTANDSDEVQVPEVLAKEAEALAEIVKEIKTKKEVATKKPTKKRARK